MGMHTETGNFRRPGEDQDVFPSAGTSLKWKYDAVRKVIRYDFYLFGDTAPSEWRVDFLKPNEDFSYLDAVGCVDKDCSPGNRFHWEWVQIANNNVYFTECAYFPDDCGTGYRQVGFEWCSWLRRKRRC